MKKKTLYLILALALIAALLLSRSTLCAGQSAPVDAALQATAAPVPDLPLITDDAADGAEEGEVLPLLPEMNPPAEAEPEPEQTEAPTEASTETEAPIDENGAYTSKDDVALYLATYGTLPRNFITKNEARALGWSGGGLDGYADGMSIGGDRFGNMEGLLPEQKGRTYYECDIGTMHKGSRGAKRIVFSNDGLIYYTSDHYESFTLLYGEE